MSCTELPLEYVEYKNIDLMKDKKLFWFVNGLSLALALAMFIPALIMVGFDVENLELGQYLIKLAVVVVGMVVYIILHELVHGVFFKLFCKGAKLNFGLTKTAAYCGSNSYYTKAQYIVIGLAPVVIWGAVLLILNLFLPFGWFWPVYIIQLMNISGAAGDFTVTVMLLKAPKEVLVYDSGSAMIFYSKTA